MTHTHKRRLIIAIIAAAGSLLAVTLYLQGDIAEKNITRADEQDLIEPAKP